MADGQAGENGHRVRSRAEWACARGHVTVTGHVLCLAGERVMDLQKTLKSAIPACHVQVS